MRTAVVATLLAVAGAFGAAAQNRPVEVRVKVDLARGSARIVLSHSESIHYTVRPVRGRIEVTYAGAITPDPAGQQLDDAILERFDMGGERTLTFFTGPGYQSYETFELRNPFRLVIDLQGTRAGGSRETPRTTPADTGTIVVLDPGHGGVEEGAVGPTGLREKDVTLDLSRRLRQELQKTPGITVVLTRDEDRYVDLDERTAIANHNQADLFISIHVNASRRVSARGAETYFLSDEASDDEARTLAALENRGLDVDEKTMSKKDPQTGLELVLWDLAQNQYMAESAALAESVQRHFNDMMDTRDRGVRQAAFRVLMGATMPAILVEVGFISNPEEERGLKTLSHRNQVTEALAQAVRDYLADLQYLSRPGGRRSAGPAGGRSGNP